MSSSREPQYYDNDLLTFPSPELEWGGVRFRHVSNARYDKGKFRTNRLEAAALVTELVSRLRDLATPRRSLEVVTFSKAQQVIVENLIDEERRKYPEVEHHFGDDPPLEGEPAFVRISKTSKVTSATSSSSPFARRGRKVKGLI